MIIFNRNTSLLVFKNLDGDEEIKQATYVFKAGAPLEATIIEEYEQFVDLEFKGLGTAFGISRSSFINLP